MIENLNLCYGKPQLRGPGSIQISRDLIYVSLSNLHVSGQVSKWSEWYTTSTEPDVTQKRERTVTEPPEEGGEECPDLVQVIS